MRARLAPKSPSPLIASHMRGICSALLPTGETWALNGARWRMQAAPLRNIWPHLMYAAFCCGFAGDAEVYLPGVCAGSHE